MNSNTSHPDSYPGILTRKSLLALLQIALEEKSLRFARQAAMTWLAVYPGDLGVSLFQAKILHADGKDQQALALAQKLLKTDAEFLEAYELIALICEINSQEKRIEAYGAIHALGGSIPDGIQIPTWAAALGQAREKFSQNQIVDGEKLILQALGLAPELLLPATFHMEATLSHEDEMMAFRLATLYHERWPECLHFTVSLAIAQMEMGNQAEAVQLLHQCASQDVTGQVITHLLGADHRFKNLWSDNPEIHFDLPVPAEVAGRLGWNRLSAGSPEQASLEIGTALPQNEVIPEEEQPIKVEESGNEGESTNPCAEELMGSAGLQQSESPTGLETDVQPPAALGDAKPVVPAHIKPARDKKYEERIRSVEDAFERLGKKFKQPQVSRADGRFPMYVVFTSRKGLEKQYGEQTAAVLLGEMEKLIGIIRRRKGWGALVFCPDDVSSAARFGLKTVDGNDPWKLKLSLVDLDQSLRKKGEMIGALLIVGGDEVVPFHQLPNPTQDQDNVVLSDNPYSTVDANYFVPEWPVGRLPGETGPDVGLLLEQIRRVVKFHMQIRQSDTWLNRFLGQINPVRQVREILAAKSLFPLYSSFGYSAAVWREASNIVFQSIGDVRNLVISPPKTTGVIRSDKLNNVMLSYFNLHGMKDTAEWYGQKSGDDHSSAPDYPVALAPRDLEKNGKAPQVVFSEACYGAEIEKRTGDTAISLKFINIGTLAFVGSTAIAYGAVGQPVLDADLIGVYFWKNLRAGFTVGAALMQAKLELVREMNRRQGYLDGEDQKTLISFVLFGDPLTGLTISTPKAKGFLRMEKSIAVPTICEHQNTEEELIRIPGPVLEEVKLLVEQYLPGLELAHFQISEQNINCDGTDHDCATSEMGGKGNPLTDAHNVVVTISKSVRIMQHEHVQYARVTLNKRGKMIKLVVSR